VLQCCDAATAAAAAQCCFCHTYAAMLLLPQPKTVILVVFASLLSTSTDLNRPAFGLAFNFY